MARCSSVLMVLALSLLAFVSLAVPAQGAPDENSPSVTYVAHSHHSRQRAPRMAISVTSIEPRGGPRMTGVRLLAFPREKVAFEGQAALELEMAMKNVPWDDNSEEGYTFKTVVEEGKHLVSPDSAILQIMEDVFREISIKEISLRFHVGLVRLFVELCKEVREREDIHVVALSGGCFQNKFLLENLLALLEAEGFEVLTHSLVPTNDGGLALGQSVVASYQIS